MADNKAAGSTIAPSRIKMKLMGRKRGMTQVFDEKGDAVTCTVIEVQPNVVAQIKTIEKDGYNAVQLGFDEVKTKDPRTVENRIAKPLLGHFAKAGVKAQRFLQESFVENIDSYQVAQPIGVEIFSDTQYIDATAFSKGKGFQGTIKRYNFSGGPASHGSGFHRHGGSTGMRSSPGRCLPNTKMPGHMGDEKVTVQNLRVVLVDPKECLVVVEGAVPGPVNGFVTLSAATKRKNVKKK